MIDWTPPALLEGEQTYAAGLASIWSEQGAIVIRTIMLAAIMWGSITIVGMRTELSVVQAKQLDVLRRLDANDLRLENGIDDRWRRRDHDAYAAAIEARLAQHEARMEGQSRVISTIVVATTKRNP